MNTDNPKSPEQQAKEAAETEYPIWPNKFKDKDEWLPEDITKREQKAFVKGWNAHAEHMRDTQQGGGTGYYLVPENLVDEWANGDSIKQLIHDIQACKVVPREPTPTQQGGEGKRDKVKWEDICIGIPEVRILDINDPVIAHAIKRTQNAQEKCIKLKDIDIEKIKNIYITI